MVLNDAWKLVLNQHIQYFIPWHSQFEKKKKRQNNASKLKTNKTKQNDGAQKKLTEDSQREKNSCDFDLRLLYSTDRGKDFST